MTLCFIRTPASPFTATIAAVPKIALWLIAMLVVVLPAAPAGAVDTRPRLFITTDIGGDPDDQQSLVRLLAHADAFRFEGFVASSSGTPGELGNPAPQPQQITNQINAYGQHYANLQLHSADFPTPASLLSKVYAGNASRGVSAIGVGNATAGSNALIAAVDASTESLNLAIWGGATELAQALTDVQATRTPAQVATFVSKLNVFSVNDQDGYVSAAQGTLSWVKQQFPQMLIIDPTPAGASPDDAIERFNSTYRGFYQNDSATEDASSTPIPLVAPGLETLNNQAWATANIATNHGALGALYPTNVLQNPATTRNTLGVKEGDTPAWLYFFQNGLNTPDQPDIGSWGGRYASAGDGTNHYVPAFDALPDPAVTDPATRAKWTIARYREAYQNEFAARMDWFVDDFASANHAPEPLQGYTGPDITQTDPDEFVFLISGGWTDPDNDPLTFSWWLYEDASTGTLPQAELDNIANATSAALFLDLAGVANGSVFQLILEVTDTAAISLTRYERFIIRVGELAALIGDFNGSGQVEQGDLDLVLQNWGDDTAVTGIPAGWVNDNIGIGQIEQTELDKVLQNWGATASPDFSGSPVPEPAAVVLLSTATLWRRRR